MSSTATDADIEGNDNVASSGVGDIEVAQWESKSSSGG